ncbi:TerC family protein [Aquipuribacter hungaricus]|uniref:TerC family protein n=1 Tax=Aquipuribacter hungaricus TaxID=545624 RepID=A0ABV7WK01_9MICO
MLSSVHALALPASTAPQAGTGTLESIGTPWLWGLTVAAVVGLFVFDFLLTRRPHDVSLKEAAGWSAFYVALPLLFGVYVLTQHGTQTGVEYYTGYIVEKSLSVDNLFVFILIMGAFAVPRQLQQRALLWGIAGALVLRAVFIAVGAVAIARLDFAFLVFGAILIATAVHLLREELKGEKKEIHVSELKVVRLVRRLTPVSDDYAGTKFSVRRDGTRYLTPFALVVIVLLFTDVVFAVDSVPAVYGITGDPYLVFATNAFALLGLRALYFLLEGALSKLVHLSYGLSFILAFIGVKLLLHWGHGIWTWLPEIPTLLSLVVIVGALVTVTVTSLLAGRRPEVDPDLLPPAQVRGATDRGVDDRGATDEDRETVDERS